VIFILGGLAFGAAWGTVYVAIAATTGACLSFLIARYAARAAVARWMAGYPASSAWTARWRATASAS